MKKIAMLLLSVIVLLSYISAQEVKKDTLILSKKEIKKKLKEEQEAKLEKQFENIYQMLQDRLFVFEADFFETEKGQTININSRLNFSKVDSTIIILQLSPQFSYGGDNGFGGLTEQGTITKYKLSKNDKQKVCYLSLAYKDNHLNYIQVFYNVNADGYSECNITFTGASSQIRFKGQLVATNKTIIRQGLLRK